MALTLVFKSKRKKQLGHLLLKTTLKYKALNFRAAGENATFWNIENFVLKYMIYYYIYLKMYFYVL